MPQLSGSVLMVNCMAHHLYQSGRPYGTSASREGTRSDLAGVVGIYGDMESNSDFRAAASS